MTARRLVPHSHVLRWQSHLRAAVGRAFAAQTSHVHLALSAASTKPRTRALAAASAAPLWTPDSWSRNVDRELTPVATAVAKSAVTAAAAAVPAALLWGAATSETSIASRLVGLALSAGAGIGDRLNAAAASSAPGDFTAVAAVLSGGASILSDSLSAGAQQAANAATYDVTSYLSTYAGNIYSGATSTWNAVGDDRTRPDHADADGQEVAMNEPFSVGGEDLFYPGDPAGSDAQILNCRCWLTTEGVPEDVASGDSGCAGPFPD